MNTELKKIAQSVPDLPDLVAARREPARTGSMSPTKYGRVYGKFIPSKTGSVMVHSKIDGAIERYPMTRRERRLLARGK